QDMLARERPSSLRDRIHWDADVVVRLAALDDLDQPLVFFRARLRAQRVDVIFGDHRARRRRNPLVEGFHVERDAHAAKLTWSRAEMAIHMHPGRARTPPSTCAP